MAYDSRLGSDLLQVNPYGFRVPAPIAAGEEIGVNILVGINTDGYAEKAAEAQGYQMILVCTEEVAGGASDGDVVAEDQLRRDAVLLLGGTGFTQADLGKTAYIVDHETVSTDDDSGNRDAAGQIVEVVSTTQVRVHIA